MLLCGWLHPTQLPIHAACPDVGDVLVQVPGPGRPQQPAPAGAYAQGALQLVQCQVAHTVSTLSLLNLHRCGMLCTYVHLRIDIGLSTPLLRDEHNSHVNSMQQIL